MLFVGKEVRPGKRLCTVHDGVEEKPVILSGKRIDQLAQFFERNPQIIGAADAESMLGRRVTAADINEALAFVIPQLAYTEAYVPSKLYTPMQYRELVPVTTEAGPWAESIRYEKADMSGQADWIGEKGDDIPTANVELDDTSRTVGHGGIAYEVTLQELRQSAYLRRPLSERKQAAAVEAAERFINKVAIFGSAKKNMTGFLNQASALQVAVGGTGGGTSLTGNWDTTASPDQILADLNWGLNKVYTAMEFNDVVTDIRVPAAAWTRFCSTARTSQSDTTILEFLLRNNISKAERNVQLTIGPCHGAATAGAATTGGAVSGANSRVVFYIKRMSNLRFHIPMPLQFIAPQLRDLHIRVPGELRLGGLELTYTNSMLYMDKVLAGG